MVHFHCVLKVEGDDIAERFAGISDGVADRTDGVTERVSGFVDLTVDHPQHPADSEQDGDEYHQECGYRSRHLF